MMKNIFILLVYCFTVVLSAMARDNKNIINGVPWFDTEGNIINAHGACIIEDNIPSNISATLSPATRESTLMFAFHLWAEILTTVLTSASSSLITGM